MNNVLNKLNTSFFKCLNFNSAFIENLLQFLDESERILLMCKK